MSDNGTENIVVRRFVVSVTCRMFGCSNARDKNCLTSSAEAAGEISRCLCQLSVDLHVVITSDLAFTHSDEGINNHK